MSSKHPSLIESIACLNRKFLALDYHQKRVEETFKKLYNTKSPFQLDRIPIDSEVEDGLYKCKIVYNKLHILSVSFTPYKDRKDLKFSLIQANHIEYSYKWENRIVFDKLLNYQNKKKQYVDDIIIVKNNLITDSSYTNLVFKRKNQWFTPAKPLLKGTYRQQMIEQKKIIPINIGYANLNNNYDISIQSFETFKTINALLRWTREEIPIKNIINLKPVQGGFCL